MIKSKEEAMGVLLGTNDGPSSVFFTEKRQDGSRGPYYDFITWDKDNGPDFAFMISVYGETGDISGGSAPFMSNSHCHATKYYKELLGLTHEEMFALSVEQTEAFKNSPEGMALEKFGKRFIPKSNEPYPKPPGGFFIPMDGAWLKGYLATVREISGQHN